MFQNGLKNKDIDLLKVYKPKKEASPYVGTLKYLVFPISAAVILISWFGIVTYQNHALDSDIAAAKAELKQVQKQIASRRRQQKDATTQIFAGLVKCADCGWSMSFGTNKNNKKPFHYFNCTSYRQMGKIEGACTAHYIRYDVLYTYVLSRIQYWSHRAQLSEEKLLQQILKNGHR